MIYNIEEHARIQATFLAKAYGSDHLLREAQKKGSLKLLYEGVNPDEVKKDIENTKKIIEKIIALFPADTAAPVVDQLKKFSQAIPNPSNVETELFAGDDAKMKEVAKKVSTSTGNAVRAASSLANGMQLVAKALEPFTKELSADELEKPIGELFSDAATKDKFIPKDKFEAGIKKAFVPDKGFESAFQKGIKGAQAGAEKGETGIGKLFSKITKFFAGATFQKSAVEAFPDLFEGFKAYINAAKIKDLIETAGKVKAEGGKLTVAAEDAATAGASAAAAAGGAPVDDKGSGGGGDATPEGGADVAAGDPELANKLADQIEKLLGDKGADAAKALRDMGKGTDPKKASSGLDKETQELLKALLTRLGEKGTDADPAKVADEAAKDAGVEGGEKEGESETSDIPPGTVVKVDDTSYQLGKPDSKFAPSMWYKKGLQGSAIRSNAEKVQADKDLMEKIKDAAKTAVSELKDKDSIKKSIAKFKDRLSDTTQKELKDLGLLERRMMRVPRLTEAFAFDEIKKVAKTKEKDENLVVERWQKLAGIK